MKRPYVIFIVLTIAAVNLSAPFAARRAGAQLRLAAGGKAGASRTAASANRCREIRTATQVGLANGRVSLRFDRTTGALVSLHNDLCRDEYLKSPGREGNPFRAYLDTTELPPPAVDPGWWGGKIEGSLGGRLLEAADCRLVSSSFHRQSGAGLLSLTLGSEPYGLEFALQVRLADGDDAIDCALTARNTGHAAHTLLMAFPHLTGLQIGPRRDTNLGLLLHSFGTPGAPAWTDSGGFYGREVTMQWQAVYDPTANEGFGFITMDPELRPKLLRRFAPSGMSALYLPAANLPPGASLRLPPARLIVHRGNWRVVARRYGDWFRHQFPPRRPPNWLRDVDLYVGPWIPDAKSVVEAQSHPQSGGFTSFRQMPQLYLNDQYDLKEWAQYNQGVFANPATYGAYMADGEYQLRTDLGGPQAMREGVAQLHRQGRRLIFYVAGNSVLRDSALLKGSDPQDWMLMDRPGHMYDIGYPNGISVCPGYGPWQDHLADVCKRLLRETGADGVRLDELASFTPCFNPAHHHANPFDSNRWLNELCRKVRAAMDTVNPDAILLTEGPLDHLSVACNGALQMFSPGRDIDAMRVALPGYIGFAYHPGAVEAARNGWIGGKTTAHRVEWPWANYRGMKGKPADYAPGPGQETRWHELRASFPEALIDGDVTLEDPQAPDEARWVGRLWRGRRYWVMISGTEDGSPLAGPTRVRLPELPPQVRCAYEIDADTLTMRDARLQRIGNVAWVDVRSGFSAVLLPLPDCAPLLQLTSDRIMLSAGQAATIDVRAFAPWRHSSGPLHCTVAAPGLIATPMQLTVPGRIQVRAPVGTEPGWRFLRITGDCLPLKRWLHVVAAAP
jgi:hypothetical protein